MTTRPYTELLEQVKALAGAPLATAEQSRIKIFANRRARKAHRESPYWPRFLKVGEERIVSEAGLLPLEETGLETIDQIIRIHAQDPFKQDAAFEYVDYYHDSTGIQITGYQPATASFGDTLIVTGTISPDYNGEYFATGIAPDSSTFGVIWSINGESSWTSGRWLYMSYDLFGWQLSATVDGVFRGNGWFGYTEPDQTDPSQIQNWTSDDGDSGTPVVTYQSNYSVYVTYLAAPPTYGTGDGEESDVPEEWFEYMAQGAYCDWLRSDGQTEKALAEEVIAEALLNQQLEKVSRQNGNQVITRQLSHGNMQWR